ncbi:RAD55 family ATPase [Thermococcus sp.]
MFYSRTKTYIKEIDEAIGGGVTRGAIFTLSYDTYSLGWMIGFEILKNMIQHHNSYGVIHNYLLPPPKLISRAMSVGLDIRNSCTIIDVFGSKYNIPPIQGANIVQISNPNPETLNPKIEAIYDSKIFPAAKNKKIVRLVYTIEGMSTIFGEKITIKLLNSEMAYLGRKYSEWDILTILLLNRDAVSRHLSAWISSISDDVILFKSEITDGKVIETMTIIKSQHSDFEPITYRYSAVPDEERNSKFTFRFHSH